MSSMSLLVLNAVAVGFGMAVVYGLAGVILGGRMPGSSHEGRVRPAVRRAGFALVIVVAWLVGGALRADDAARHYFTSLAGAGAVGKIAVQKIPTAPPFWVVKLDADVMQPDGVTVGYTSHQFLVVEPWIGWVIVIAAG